MFEVIAVAPDKKVAVLFGDADAQGVKGVYFFADGIVVFWAQFAQCGCSAAVVVKGDVCGFDFGRLGGKADDAGGSGSFAKAVFKGSERAGWFVCFAEFLEFLG